MDQESIWDVRFSEGPWCACGTEWLESLRDVLGPGDGRRVLELGCGDGLCAKLLSNWGFEVVANDISTEALRQLGESDLRIQLSQFDMSQGIPFASQSFDVVLSNLSSHYFSQRGTHFVYAEVRRVLKVGGLFLVRVNDAREYELKKRDTIEEIEPGYVLSRNGKYKRYFSRSGLNNALSAYSTKRLEEVSFSCAGRDKYALLAIVQKPQRVVVEPRVRYLPLLCPDRVFGGSTVDVVEELRKDRSRIIHCSSFRRLQQKAQVFSLESNANIRSRLTHTIEVADIARTIAQKVSADFRSGIPEGLREAFSMVVENASLLHDIGNPPFGHFGESAVRSWAKDNKGLILGGMVPASGEDGLLEDFFHFDGNPQGFRVATKLHINQEGCRRSLDLTSATLAASMKYRGIPTKAGDKPGVFFSEEDLAEQVLQKCMPEGLPPFGRHPASYIVEAADDIAYLFSDIADGIKKGAVTFEGYIDALQERWEEFSGKLVAYQEPSWFKEGPFNNFSSSWSKELIRTATEAYIQSFDDMFDGPVGSLLGQDEESYRIISILKKTNRDFLYKTRKAEEVEIGGHRIITGLLDSYGKLLNLESQEFRSLMDDSAFVSSDPFLRRVANRVSRRLYDNYKQDLKNLGEANSFKERWLRTHLIIDQVVSMTDVYALADYKVFCGML